MAPSDISLSRVAHNPLVPLRTATPPVSPATPASSAPETKAPSFTAVLASIAAAAGTTAASTAPAASGLKAPAAAAASSTPTDGAGGPRFAANRSLTGHIRTTPGAVTGAAAAPATAPAAALAAGPGAPPIPASMAAPVNTGSGTASTPTADDSDLYYQGVTGTVAGGGNYGLNSDYFATQGATTSIGQILGLQSITIPSGAGAEGGPFAAPSSSGLVTPSGDANTGQMLSELQNTAPGNWSTILGGYGIADSAGINNQISELFGVNQAVPYVG